LSHITKFIRPELKVLDPKEGIISAIVSTESVDRDGDIIRQANWDLGHFKSHPILLSSHNYRGLRNQIGEWTSMDIEGKELLGTAKYYINEGNEEADWGFNLAQKGRAAFSVGFVPDMGAAKEITIDGKSAYEFRGQELLEVSQVTVPSNPQALQALKGLGSVHPEVDLLVSEMLEDMEEIEELKEEIVSNDTIFLTNEVMSAIEEATLEIKSDLLNALDEIKALVREATENRDKPEKNLPDAESIVRDAIRETIKNSEVRNGR